ncbi:exosortase E/protease, VPEID-CTERM system [Methylomonas paludis]|uniref:Exosortase E/protease, VPEID-CTERM system n=1 Tax=Methylomonas paludis TaxID=1173101 RepID=A0A975R869_9GAMM|nr:exosortase E/protease, VPEID-CTERM system [Methylomonas paludis]QWF70055.1 exosortase E/protease, VPEID-CTERM system [Methylomonas paludis]
MHSLFYKKNFQYIAVGILIFELLAVGFAFDIRNILAPNKGELSKILEPEQGFRFFLLVCALVVAIDAKTKKLHSALKAITFQFKPISCILHFIGFFLFLIISSKLDVTYNWPQGNLRSLYIFGWLLSAFAFVVALILAVMPINSIGNILIIIRKPILISAGTSFLIYQATFITQWQWQEFNALAFNSVEMLLKQVFSEVLVDQSQFVIGTPTFMVKIAKECSGYEGMGLIGAFIVLYLWLYRTDLKFPNGLLLLPIGLILIWCFNIIRITVLIIIGARISEEIAVNGFHSQAGWIAFIGVSFTVMWAAPKLFGNRQLVHVNNSQQHESLDMVTALILPFVLLLALQMLTTAFTITSDIWYPLKIIVVSYVIWRNKSVYKKIIYNPSIIGLWVGVFVFVIWCLAEYRQPNSNLAPQWFVEMPESYKAVWLALRVMGSIIVVPIAEELFFRGYMLNKIAEIKIKILDTRYISIIAWFSSSLLFGLLHQRWQIASIAGLAFAYAQHKSGKLADAVIAHYVANSLIAVMVIGFGQWTFWN